MNYDELLTARKKLFDALNEYSNATGSDFIDIKYFSQKDGIKARIATDELIESTDDGGRVWWTI